MIARIFFSLVFGFSIILSAKAQILPGEGNLHVHFLLDGEQRNFNLTMSISPDEAAYFKPADFQKKIEGHLEAALSIFTDANDPQSIRKQIQTCIEEFSSFYDAPWQTTYYETPFYLETCMTKNNKWLKIFSYSSEKEKFLFTVRFDKDK